MMSGNNLFMKRQARTIDLLNELENTATPFIIHQTEVDMETEFDYSCNKINGNKLEDKLEDIVVKAISTNDTKKNLHTLLREKELRMQEIEELILENAIVKKIEEKLYIWNGRYYRQLNEESFVREARSVLPKEMQKRIPYYNRFQDTYKYMQANGSLTGEFKKKDVATAKHMIVFQNGIYNAEKDALINSTSKYPVLFEINAEYLGNEEVQTPYMDKIIMQATGGDVDTLERFYQCLGYIYSQGTEAKKFFVFGTAPDSGKSIIGEFIAKTIGEGNISTISLNEFGSRFKLGSISQRILNYNMDLPAGMLDKKSVQLLKLLTGDAKIDCEEKYVQNRTVTHHCKFLFATNHPIQLKEDDEAFYHRMLLIPFVKSIADENRDYSMPEKLWKERHAIATRAAHAYRDLYRNNFVFHESELADRMLNEWRENCRQKCLKEFFYQCCEVEKEREDAFVPTDALFKAYRKFCAEKDIHIRDSDKPQFSRLFKNTFGIASTKRRVDGYNSPVNGYLGIQLIE